MAMLGGWLSLCLPKIAAFESARAFQHWPKKQAAVGALDYRLEYLQPDGVSATLFEASHDREAVEKARAFYRISPHLAGAPARSQRGSVAA